MALITTASSADDKKAPDAKKLVGKWVPKDLPEGVKIEIEFTKDNKVSIKIEIGEKDESKAGTYKLEANKLTVTIGEEKAKTSTILKLTDEILEIKNESDKTTTFTRVKAK